MSEINPFNEFEAVIFEDSSGAQLVEEAEAFLIEASCAGSGKDSIFKRIGRAMMDGLSNGGPWLYLGGGVYIPPQTQAGGNNRNTQQ